MSSWPEYGPYQDELFSETTILNTLHLGGRACWACSLTGTGPFICPVSPIDDSQRKVWQGAGLFTFSHESTENAIPLCPNCQAQFDRPLDPIFVFFPADIQFFIDFEHRDRRRREQTATETGVSLANLPRHVPISEDYRQHEISMNRISPTAVGGRYVRVFLIKYIHGALIPGFEETRSAPKEWHGAPLASFRRAFLALGSVRFCTIVDHDTQRKLEELRGLYFSDDHISAEQLSLRDIHNPQVRVDQKRHADHDEDDNDSDETEPGHVNKKPNNTGKDFIQTSAEIVQSST